MEENTSLSSSSKIGISNLPWEILQVIFCYLDGKSVMVCQLVCKTWKEHVNYLEQKNSHWYGLCQKDIPGWAQFDLLDNMYPTHWKNKSAVDWNLVYKYWYTWDTLQGTPHLVKKFDMGLNGISSIKVSGEWLLISTCEGRGKLSAQNFAKNKIIDIYVGGGAILNFELVNSDKECLSNVNPSKELEDVFSTLEHNEIWLELTDCYIQLGKTYCHKIDKTQQQIRHSHGYELRLVKELQNSVLYLNKTCSKVSGPAVMEVILPLNYSVVLDFWLNKVVLGCTWGSYHSRLKQIDNLSISFKSQIVNKQEQYCLKKPFERYYTWQSKLFIMHSSGHEISFHVDGQSSEQETSLRKGCITAVLFYASYLFLGSDRGQLLIYHLQKPEDCLSVIVYGDSQPWTIHLGYTKIIHIAVAEPNHHLRGEKPMVICSSPKDVYFITFPDLKFD